MPVAHPLPSPAPSTPSTPLSTGLTPGRTLAIGASALFFVLCMFSLRPEAMLIGVAQLAAAIWAPPIIGRLFWGALGLYLGYHALVFGSVPMIIVAAVMGLPAIIPSRARGADMRWQRRVERLRAEAEAEGEGVD